MYYGLYLLITIKNKYKYKYTVIKELINLVPWNIYFKRFYYILQEKMKKYYIVIVIELIKVCKCD